MLDQEEKDPIKVKADPKVTRAIMLGTCKYLIFIGDKELERKTDYSLQGEPDEGSMDFWVLNEVGHFGSVEELLENSGISPEELRPGESADEIKTHYTNLGPGYGARINMHGFRVYEVGNGRDALPGWLVDLKRIHGDLTGLAESNERSAKGAWGFTVDEFTRREDEFWERPTEPNPFAESAARSRSGAKKLEREIKELEVRIEIIQSRS